MISFQLANSIHQHTPIYLLIKCLNYVILSSFDISLRFRNLFEFLLLIPDNIYWNSLIFQIVHQVWSILLGQKFLFWRTIWRNRLCFDKIVVMSHPTHFLCYDVSSLNQAVEFFTFIKTWFASLVCNVSISTQLMSLLTLSNVFIVYLEILLAKPRGSWRDYGITELLNVVLRRV